MPTMELTPTPAISTTTKYVAGHMLIVHGLSELDREIPHVSVLWLYHGRLQTHASMTDVAARSVDAWLQRQSKDRGLIAIVLDQRNHGTREVHPLANESWGEGNSSHAPDMFGVIAGSVVDTGLLIDLVQGSIFPEKPDGFIDAHYALGVSLGGHGVWQLIFADERVTAGVSIIGCPDYIYLLSERARSLKRSTYDAQDQGASFLGSKDFPPDLVRACQKYDPKALLFGARNSPSWPLPADQERRVKQLLQSRLHGKRFLNCSGGLDRLVPYRCSEPFLGSFKAAVDGFAELKFGFDDRIYASAGHEFNPEMTHDAVQFIVQATAADANKAHGVVSETAAKI